MLYPPRTVSRSSFEQTFKKHLASEQRREVMSTLRATLRRDTTLGEVVDAATKVGWSEAMGELTLADLANALLDERSRSGGSTRAPSKTTADDEADELETSTSRVTTSGSAAALATELDASLGRDRRAAGTAGTPAAAVEVEVVSATSARGKKTSKKVASSPAKPTKAASSATTTATKAAPASKATARAGKPAAVQAAAKPAATKVAKPSPASKTTATSKAGAGKATKPAAGKPAKKKATRR